jgi:hypothetical protein
MCWFKKRTLDNPPQMPSTEDQKLIFSLSQGPAHNLRTYQAYDINDYRFYTEEKDMNSKYQNPRATMLSFTDHESTVKERFYGRIEEIWELDYSVLGFHANNKKIIICTTPKRPRYIY